MTLLDKLGGDAALEAVVDEMYTRLLADEATAQFFAGFSKAHLKHHQVKFMKVAFTEIPADFDVPAVIRTKHQKLFATKGLNETHFDKVVEHFVGACRHYNVAAEHIDEAVAVLAPLRRVFEEAAVEFASKSS